VARFRGRSWWLGVAVGAALAAAPAVAAKRPATPAVARGWTVDFIGTGSFKSTDVMAVEGVGKCAKAKNTAVETSTLAWDTRYVVTIPAKPEAVLPEVNGTAFKTKTPPKWKQTATIAPAGCLGGSQSCSGSLGPAGSDNPAVAGDSRRPVMVISFSDGSYQVDIQSVPDWVVEPGVTGSSTCSLYNHYHTALAPFSLASKLNPNNKGLTVANAMQGLVFVPPAKFAAGKAFTLPVKKDVSGQPPASCLKLTIDSVSCSEGLEWSGTVEFTPL
jgi:hypothetical protein